VKKQRRQKKFMDEGKKSSMTPSKLRALKVMGFTWAIRKRQPWAKRKSQPSTDNRFMEGQYDSDASSTAEGGGESLSGAPGDGRVVAQRQPAKLKTGAHGRTTASVDAITDSNAPSTGEGGGNYLPWMTGDSRVDSPRQPFDPANATRGPTAAEVDAILADFYRNHRG
jgi:hypothetical protein